jgi:hypothetical protein
MFESDQHEFDDEYEELSHAAPPFPKQPAVPPSPVAKQPVATVQQPAAASATTKAPAAPQPTSSQPAASGTTFQPPIATGSTLKPSVSPAEAMRSHFATTSVVRPIASPAAVAEPPAAEPIVEEPPVVEQEPTAPAPEPEGAYEEHRLEFVDPAQQPEPPKKKPPLLLFAGAAALIIFAIFVAYTATKPKDNAPPPGDMGPGIVAVSGLRGHLDTRWEGSAKTGRLAYQLRIEPMEDRWQSGFSQAVLKAQLPMYVNVRLLDATGFALCGKEIDFPFDPQNGYVPLMTPPLVGSDGKKLSAAQRDEMVQAARQSEIAQLRASEVTREHGKDIFQNQLTNDGEVTAVNVQGALPCAPDQFKQASYWDMNTNFPTLDQQAGLLTPKAAGERASEAAPGGSSRARRPTFRPQEGFVIQGDERVKEYDSSSGTLFVQGKTFQVDRRSGQVTATEWANTNTLIHYRCDQQSNCALSAAGGSAILHASLN